MTEESTDAPGRPGDPSAIFPPLLADTLDQLTVALKLLSCDRSTTLPAPSALIDMKPVPIPLTPLRSSRPPPCA
jgi:hypothetical protein